jgi:co-chaperonin GroES (HSP10)
MGYDKYCFIKPLEAQDSYLNKNSKNEPLRGTVRYINDELIKKGVKIGDQILYEPESEYEFVVDDEKLYRMFTKNITVVL